MTSPPPLTSIRVLEFAGLAPGPFAGLLLADAGASVLRVDRSVPNITHSNTSSPPPPTPDLLTRHKTSISIDLKSPSGITLIKSLLPHTDILIDPFRPGILEKLGLSPSILQAINPRLIIARMTGFRRDGKYKSMAGHDINYIAVSGALSLFGREGEKPLAPGNILGDFAGGGAVLFQGILMALLARERTGRGQVVEANMVDGAAYLATFPRMLSRTPMWGGPRGTNVLDGGCPWYDTYETADGKFMAVGALEPQFFKELIRGLGLAGRGIEGSRQDRRTWPELKQLFTGIFKGRTRREWEDTFDGTDACVTPVLTFDDLERDESREGDQRPVVTLRETPALAVKRGKEGRDVVTGQGEGVDGDGWVGSGLGPGVGGEKTLEEWTGWKRGKEFEVREGGLCWVGNGESKL